MPSKSNPRPRAGRATARKARSGNQGNPEKQRDPLFWFGPVLAGDRLVVAGTSEAALAVSPYTGEILGRQPLSQRAAPVGPVVAHRTMLLLSDDGRLLALR